MGRNASARNGSVRLDASNTRRATMPQPPPDRCETISNASDPSATLDPEHERHEVRAQELLVVGAVAQAAQDHADHADHQRDPLQTGQARRLGIGGCQSSA